MGAQERAVEFWAASESDAAAFPAIENSRIVVEPVFNDILSGSPFAAIKLLIRYVPIVMPPELLDRYPSRSKTRLKQRILDAAPQLDHNTFVRGNVRDQVAAYVDGIRTASLLLPKFGLSLADVRDFEALVSATTDRCLSECF